MSGAEKPSAFTKVNLLDVKDSAVAFGVSEIQEARFCGDDLGAEATGCAHHILKPGKRQAFAHRHVAAEEIYVVLSGRGRLRLDQETIDVAARDAIRVAPTVARKFEAGADGLEILVFGPRTPGDGEILNDFWTD
jgi:mannose-6-phosphate isomerase-like protein (cupin superfamily)